MRILIATYHRNVIGGTEQYLQTVIPGLLKRGHQVAVLYEKPFDPARGTIDSPEYPVAAWCLAEAGLTAVMRSASAWKPDLVYNQGLENGDLENALVDSYPTALFSHGYYGTCSTGSKCHSFPQEKPCDRLFGPACLILHYPRRCGGLRPLATWNTYRRQAQRYSRLRDYQAVLVASRHMHRELLRHGVEPNRLHVVSLPITCNGTEMKAPPTGASPQRILLLGRLTRIKGGHYLVPAVAEASTKLKRPLQLCVAGDGGERRGLEELTRRCGVNAEFPGWVDREKKMDLLRGTDLLAVPSLWPEPFGLVGLEAACWGIPAVGFALGGIPDWLVPGQTGELAPADPPTVTGLADAICRALSDPAHYAALSSGAWRQARRFDLDSHLNQLEQVLDARQESSYTNASARKSN